MDNDDARLEDLTCANLLSKFNEESEYLGTSLLACNLTEKSLTIAIYDGIGEPPF
jgi:hypothetical protein